MVLFDGINEVDGINEGNFRFPLMSYCFICVVVRAIAIFK